MPREGAYVSERESSGILNDSTWFLYTWETLKEDLPQFLFRKWIVLAIRTGFFERTYRKRRRPACSDSRRQANDGWTIVKPLDVILDEGAILVMDLAPPAFASPSLDVDWSHSTLCYFPTLLSQFKRKIASLASITSHSSKIDHYYFIFGLLIHSIQASLKIQWRVMEMKSFQFDQKLPSTGDRNGTNPPQSISFQTFD